MKKILSFIFLSIFYINLSNAADISDYSCLSKKYNDDSYFKILHKFNQEYLLFSHSILGINFINFGKITNKKINSFMSNNSDGMLVYYLSEENNNKRLLTVVTLESKKIKELNSTSIFYGKKNIDGIDFEISDFQLKNEIDNYYKNFKYLDDLNNSGNTNELKVITIDEYSCEKTSKDLKPLKSHIDALKTACLNNNDSSFDSPIKQEKYCDCLGKWFYNNMNRVEFHNFLHLSHSEKVKYFEKNEAQKMCLFYSENYKKFDKLKKKNQ